MKSKSSSHHRLAPRLMALDLESHIAEVELAKAMREEELAKIKAEQLAEAAEPKITQSKLTISLLRQEPAV